MSNGTNPAMNDAIARAEAHSPYLRRLIARMGFVSMGTVNKMTVPIDAPLPETLRKAKAELALRVALGDLSGQMSFEQVVEGLSDFADQALDLAIADAIRAHVPGAEPRGLAAIALGKHGSRELNYSSDLDPILIFDPETLPTRPNEEPGEAAVRIGRRIVETMQARTEHGYVFRIDLRLRPSPEVTPIVLPVEAAIAYYESEALPWERAAFIRARACAGDIGLGTYFLDTIKPFVWRRALDFGAISAIRSISHRIRDHHSRGQMFGPGYDLKRGRGGIRECEFFAQIHQLIHGGREPGLRVPATLGALGALAEAGRIGRDEAAELGAAYRLYRTIEHRLQMVDDQQTHSLPTSPDALDNVARLHGLQHGGALLDLLRPYVERVGRIYDGLDGAGEDGLPVEEVRLVSALEKAGFPDPAHAVARIAHWRSGSIRAVRSPAARQALEAVLPRIVEALGSAPDPMRAINQLSTLIERLPSAVNLFRLLEAQPSLLRVLTGILTHAPTLADALARRPELLDRLIDASAFDPPGTVDALAAEMDIAADGVQTASNATKSAHGEEGLSLPKARLEPAPSFETRLRQAQPLLRMSGTDVRDADLEAQLDHIRRVVSDHRFALGVQLIEGARDPLDVASGYARIAEAAIRTVAAATITEFEAAHGKVPGCELIILALGRMGGAELTHASDLDLVYLFTGAFDGDSDGRRPLGAVHYFNRLCQRVTAGLSVPTASGALYEVDTRLRPSGGDGPIAVSLDGFRTYQMESAWTWEHMALTRARVVFGSGRARAETEAIIAEALRSPRDPGTLIADAAKMRADMATHKPPKSALDVKLCPGGLVDLEFAVHVTQLKRRTGFDPHLGRAIAALSAKGLLPTDMIDAHALMTRLLVTLRLVAPDLVEPDLHTCAIIARACGVSDWAALLDRLNAVRQGVSRVWDASKDI